MKIFWSWQSDTPGKTGRHFIRRALIEAIEDLREAEDIEEPEERNAKDALHLDHDRQGVAGSPELARTIFAKIDAAAVFVADITPVSTIPARRQGEVEINEKRNMNPNVAIELGYALRHLRDDFLMVLNTYYGGREFIPFDLAGRGGPIMFCLPPDADAPTIRAESAALKTNFINALRPFLKLSGGSQPAPTFTEAPSTTSVATYFEPGEPLAIFGDDDDSVEYCCDENAGFYLRVIPFAPQSEPFYWKMLANEIVRSKLLPLWDRAGLTAGNRFGAISIEPRSSTGGEIKACTQVFTSGEIWGFTPRLLCIDEYGKYVPAPRFEGIFHQALHSYLRFLTGTLLIKPPFTIEAGAVGLKGFSIMVDFGKQIGPFYRNEIQMRFVLNDTSEEIVNAGLLRIFKEFFRASGYPRPENYNGFPGA